MPKIGPSSIVSGGLFDLERKGDRLFEIEEMESQGDFWQNRELATQVQKEKKVLLASVDSYRELEEELEEVDFLYDCALEENDTALAQEAREKYQVAKTHLSLVHQKTLFSGEVDTNNAHITINAGAGGTESCDWALMLQRMIIRWAESKGFPVTLFHERTGDSAGIKSCSFKIQGNYAFGLLKSESGVHRLVRLSPFDAGGRRHTSFASIFVSPEIDETIEVDIKDKDLNIDVYRSGGAGGQSVNTTDSAVRITHLPTGLVVTCQNERSQLQNKAQAMAVLRSRLYEREREERRRREQEVESGKKNIEWGGQIRSYVLHPYKLVKDHRTGFEFSGAQKVLDGHLDGFIDAFLRWQAEGGNKE